MNVQETSHECLLSASNSGGDLNPKAIQQTYANTGNEKGSSSEIRPPPNKLSLHEQLLKTTIPYAIKVRDIFLSLRRKENLNSINGETHTAENITSQHSSNKLNTNEPTKENESSQVGTNDKQNVPTSVNRSSLCEIPLEEKKGETGEFTSQNFSTTAKPSRSLSEILPRDQKEPTDHKASPNVGKLAKRRYSLPELSSDEDALPDAGKFSKRRRSRSLSESLSRDLRKSTDKISGKLAQPCRSLSKSFFRDLKNPIEEHEKFPSRRFSLPALLPRDEKGNTDENSSTNVRKLARRCNSLPESEIFSRDQNELTDENALKNVDKFAKQHYSNPKLFSVHPKRSKNRDAQQKFGKSSNGRYSFPIDQKGIAYKNVSSKVCKFSNRRYNLLVLHSGGQKVPVDRNVTYEKRASILRCISTNDTSKKQSSVFRDMVYANPNENALRKVKKSANRRSALSVFLSRRQKRPNDENTLLEIASSAKQFSVIRDNQSGNKNGHTKDNESLKVELFAKQPLVLHNILSGNQTSFENSASIKFSKLESDIKKYPTENTNAANNSATDYQRKPLTANNDMVTNLRENPTALNGITTSFRRESSTTGYNMDAYYQKNGLISDAPGENVIEDTRNNNSTQPYQTNKLIGKMVLPENSSTDFLRQNMPNNITSSKEGTLKNLVAFIVNEPLLLNENDTYSGRLQENVSEIDDGQGSTLPKDTNDCAEDSASSEPGASANPPAMCIELLENYKPGIYVSYPSSGSQQIRRSSPFQVNDSNVQRSGVLKTKASPMSLNRFVLLRNHTAKVRSTEPTPAGTSDVSSSEISDHILNLSSPFTKKRPREDKDVPKPSTLEKLRLLLKQRAESAKVPGSSKNSSQTDILQMPDLSSSSSSDDDCEDEVIMPFQYKY